MKSSPIVLMQLLLFGGTLEIGFAQMKEPAQLANYRSSFEKQFAAAGEEARAAYLRSLVMLENRLVVRGEYEAAIINDPSPSRLSSRRRNDVACPSRTPSPIFIFLK